MEKKTQIAMTLKRSMRHSEIPWCSTTTNVQAINLHFCKWKRYSLGRCGWLSFVFKLAQTSPTLLNHRKPSSSQKGMGHGGKYRPEKARTSTGTHKHTHTLFVWRVLRVYHCRVLLTRHHVRLTSNMYSISASVSVKPQAKQAPQ